MPHSCAALETQERRFTEHGGHFSHVLCRAEACTTVCAASPTIQTPQDVPQQNFTVKVPSFLDTNRTTQPVMTRVTRWH